MPSFYRVMLGAKSVYAKLCLEQGFIGAHFGIHQDLSTKLHNEWRTFNREFIPVYLELHPDKSKIAAGLACGALWTIAKGIRVGDVVLCPDGEGHYHVGEVTGDYYYHPGDVLPHRRRVRWLDQVINRSDLSENVRNSTGSAGTVSNITHYAEEIYRLIDGIQPGAPDESVEDPVAFAMEKHLEEFLVQNWAHSGLAKDYDIFQEDGERVGQQFPTDTGAIDILAISKDKRTLLVIELKKGRASDVVVGQILRYMGFVKSELAELGQAVRGMIIALDDDQRIRRALAIVPDVEFYRYQVSFKLVKAGQ